jgi:hypothetical protein
LTSGFFHESVSPKPPSIPLGSFQIYSKRKFTEIFATQGAPPVLLALVAIGKNSISVIILFGHLWVVVLTHRTIFSINFTLRSKLSEIIPIIATDVVDTSGNLQFATSINNTSRLVGKFTTSVC